MAEIIGGARYGRTYLQPIGKCRRRWRVMNGGIEWIRQDGTNDQDNVWEIHREIAKAVSGKLEPFHIYPYILVGEGALLEEGLCKFPLTFRPGLTHLWGFDWDFCVVYRKDTKTETETPWTVNDFQAGQIN